MEKPYGFEKIYRARHRRRPIALSWDKSAPDLPLRKTGLSPLRAVPWGTHICIFYETKQDLLDTNVAYLKAGIESKEQGLWIVSDRTTQAEAIDASRKGIPDFDQHVASGDIEFAVGDEWYTEGRLANVIQAWHKKQYQALIQGYEGLRISGNALWRHPDRWKNFADFERTLDYSMVGHKMIVLCGYSLNASQARDLLEVARAHQFTIARRNGKWDLLEVPNIEKAQKEVRLLNSDLDNLARSFPGKELLTPREKVVLAQIVKGHSSKEVARLLKISPRTVDFHRGNIMQRVGAKNAVELVRLVLGR